MAEGAGAVVGKLLIMPVEEVVGALPVQGLLARPLLVGTEAIPPFKAQHKAIVQAEEEQAAVIVILLVAIMRSTEAAVGEAVH
mgnify:CR=1 FL=1